MNVMFKEDPPRTLAMPVVVIDASQLPLRKRGRMRDEEQVLVISATPTVREAFKQCQCGFQSLGCAIGRLMAGYFRCINHAHQFRQRHI